MPTHAGGDVAYGKVPDKVIDPDNLEEAMPIIAAWLELKRLGILRTFGTGSGFGYQATVAV